jgi:hypothetical protein
MIKLEIIAVEHYVKRKLGNKKSLNVLNRKNAGRNAILNAFLL